MIRLFRGGFAAFALLTLALSDTGWAQSTTTINALPSATTPLSGSETLPIWQLGATKKVDANHLLPNSGVTAGTYGDSTHCANFTVAADGRVTSANQSTSCPGGGGGGGTPGGSNTQLQYNNAGAFGGISGATSNGTTVTLTSPTLVTPALGTPASGNLANATGYTVGNLAGLGTGVGTFLATPSSANLAATVTGETGSGALVFGTSPTIASPTFTGTASGAGTIPNSMLVTDPTNASNLSSGTVAASRLPLATTSAFGAVKPDGTTITISGGVITATGGGTGITNLTLGTGLCSSTTNPITAGGATVNLCQTLRTNSSTTDSIVSGDGGKVYTTGNAASQAISIPTVGTTGFGNGFGFTAFALGVGTATFNSSTNFDGGISAVSLTTGQGASFFDDNSLRHAIVGLPQIANNRFFGNNSGATSYGNAMTGTQATALLDVATTTIKGLVPAPGTATGKFLKDDMTWGTATGGTGCNTSGTSILSGDGAGGCSNVTIGSGLSFTGGTLSATGGGGSNAYTATFSGNANFTPGATNGAGLRLASATFTDNNTAASGTAALAVFNSIDCSSTLAATNTSVTTTHLSCVRLNGTPTTGANETVTIKSLLSLSGGGIALETSGQVVDFYNVGSPGATNTERGSLGYQSNQLRLGTQHTGTGTGRGVDIDADAASTLGIRLTTGGSVKMSITGTGISINSNMGSTNSSGPLWNNNAASNTVATLVPNQSSSNTGWGAQAAGNMSGITGGVERIRIDSSGMNIQSGVFTPKGYTVATLPASPAQGSEAFVTDATACTFAGSLTGGGSTYCPVKYDGAAWKSF